MATPTDNGPRPRVGKASWSPPAIDAVSWTALPRGVLTPKVAFLDVLGDRKSRIGGPVGLMDLSSLLWHANAIRERGPLGRFGLPWESRPAPSSGGLHVIRIVCIPVGEGIGGLYDPERHDLLGLPGMGQAEDWNARSVRDLAGATHGVTLQLAADRSKLEACYHDSGSLLWRDAGCLSAVLCLVAESLDLVSVMLGRHGTPLLRLLGLPCSFEGAGAVHVGSQGPR